MLSASLDRFNDIVNRLGEDDGIGWGDRKGRLVAAMMLTNGLSRAEAVAEMVSQPRGKRLGQRTFQGRGQGIGMIHGGLWDTSLAERLAGDD